MKRYIRSSKRIDLKLKHLSRAIDQIQDDETFSECDFQYYIEDDDPSGDSFLLWLYDRNEYIGSSEYYEYSFVENAFEKFNKAVRKDTGDIDFYFEPYDNVTFCGRASFKMVNTTGRIFPNSL